MMEETLIGVIGSSGFIGRKLCEQLIKKYNVRGGQRSPRYADANLSTNRISWQYVDVFDEMSLESFCSGCDIVINCAGPTYKIGDRIAVVANRNGSDYVDIFGGGYLEYQLYKECIEGKNYKIFAAGSMPGFSGIALKWLISKFDIIQKIKVYEGSFEKSGISACEDIILSSVKNFGLKDTYVEDMKYIRKGLEQESVLIPGVPEPVYCQYYLTQEIQHLQKKYSIPNIKVYHMNSNQKLADMLSQACFEAVFSEENVRNNAMKIYSLLNDMASKKETWYAYVVEAEGIIGHQLYQKRLVIRAKESALINVGVLESVLDEIVKREKNYGILWAYDFVDAESVMQKLSNEGIIKYYLTDIVEKYVQEVEEGEL